ncbi:hypothetical protein FXO38_35913 [Capsicum annuum]|nr:hypothetical protein FXO38_35913 [Capsicum annuum]
MNINVGKKIQQNIKGIKENMGDTLTTEQWPGLPRHKTPDGTATSMVNKAESGHKGAQTLEKPHGSSCVEVISNTDDPVIKPKKQWKNLFQSNRLTAQVMTLEFVAPTIKNGRQLWSYAKSLSKIGSELGVPLYVNACTTAVDRISYAHVLVEMDITKDLPKKIKVEDPTGRIFGQPIKYEWVPLHCPICLNIGHKCQAKEDNVAKPKGIHGIQKFRTMSCKFLFTAIYGLHSVETRKHLWTGLRQIHVGTSAAWVAMGDFNAIYREEDRMIVAQVHEAEIKDFSIFIEDIGMNIWKHNCREYTWSNGHTYSRIDWALVNTKWILGMPIVEVMVMDSGCSDHSPLSLFLAQEEYKRPKLFRFLNHLVKHEKFHEVVAIVWGRSNTIGSMAGIWQKLITMKQ